MKLINVDDLKKFITWVCGSIPYVYTRAGEVIYIDDLIDAYEPFGDSMVYVMFFKPSGKFYTVEEYKIKDRGKRIDKIFEEIKDHYANDYAGMHMVVAFDDILENSFPMMETANDRKLEG